jgi:hypothetical protein
MPHHSAVFPDRVTLPVGRFGVNSVQQSWSGMIEIE